MVCSRALEPEQIHVHESRHAALIRERLLDQLKRRAEGQHFLDRFGRSDFYFIVARFVNVLFLPAMRRNVSPFR